MNISKTSDNKGKNDISADVVVIGAGIAGTIAAKKCAQRGMHAILLEKCKLPRRKVCTGLIVSTMAQTIIAHEYGTIPDTAITDPPHIIGYQWHTSQYGDEKLDMKEIINVWRGELDYWMNQKAKEVGVEIWDETLATHVIQDDSKILVKVKNGGEERKIRASFVIGADGAASFTRKSLFPDLNVHYVSVYTECHPGSLNADRNYLHLFGSAQTRPDRDWFDVIHKKGCFLINTSSDLRSPRESNALAKKLLAEKWGFDLKSKPLWTDGTVGPTLTQETRYGKFIPAKGNVLLAGYAAGMSTPSERGEGEAINMALKSGLLAAGAIMKAADTSNEAAPIYLAELQKVLEVTRTIAADILYYTTHWTERDKLLSTLI